MSEQQKVFIFQDDKGEVSMHPEKPPFETKFEFEATLTAKQIHDIIMGDKRHIEKLMSEHIQPSLDL